MGERNCYICEKCYGNKTPYRVFVLDGQPIPRCPQHGRMRRERNHPYRKNDEAKRQ